MADAVPMDAGELGLLNPLVSAAGRLLVLLGKMRTLVQQPDVGALRASTVAALQRFDGDARASGASNETVLAARYVLCTAIDEAVANTPWGTQSGWNKQSLLVQFHNETWGGERVFQLLSRLAQDPAKHLDLLELIYSVLALGFEGRYRVVDNGRSQLDGVRARLAEIIRKNRPAHDPQLSLHWQGAGASVRRASDSVPLWVIGSGLLLLLTLVWLGLRIWLNHQSDEVWSQLSTLRVPSVAVAAPVAPARSPRLARFLEPEIRQGLVTVTDEANRSVVRLRGDAFFGSGNAEPLAPATPVLTRIAQALAEVPGEVLINGHSDSQPIRSLRYPSNWHLSAARAQAVKEALSPRVDAARMTTEGKADAEPVAPNDTPANRARNRRVEIVLLTPVTQQGSGAAGAAR
ncbi:DotU family type VI secretion system protein [Diaphorobacter aerolatus]|uniref:DotU family type VI secretion system protein n=1 Tax=Diaphorobacter aerolatus TaxID=1288495 RepID=UPI001D02DFA2|nr:DotU family type VI secretion system protein [Diaphorobacter aerolatus]